jgi:hypothetical protein
LLQKQAKFEDSVLKKKRKGRGDFCQKIESVSPFDDFLPPRKMTDSEIEESGSECIF